MFPVFQMILRCFTDSLKKIAPTTICITFLEGHQDHLLIHEFFTRSLLAIAFVSTDDEGKGYFKLYQPHAGQSFSMKLTAVWNGTDFIGGGLTKHFPPQSNE